MSLSTDSTLSVTGSELLIGGTGMNRIAAMWSHLEHQGHVYTLIEKNSISLIEKPKNVGELAVLRTFLTLEAAKQYKAYLVEYGTYRPSELGISALTVKELFANLEELEQVSSLIYGMPLRITLAEIERLDNCDKIFEDELFNGLTEVN